MILVVWHRWYSSLTLREGAVDCVAQMVQLHGSCEGVPVAWHKQYSCLTPCEGVCLLVEGTVVGLHVRGFGCVVRMVQLSDSLRRAVGRCAGIIFILEVLMMETMKTMYLMLVITAAALHPWFQHHWL